MYWYCLELIAQNVERHNLRFELEHDSEIIAADTGIHYERVQEMMTYMVNIRLFEQSEGIIFCLKMATRTDEYTQKLIKDHDIIGTISRQSPDKVRSNRIEENRTEQIKQKRKDINAPSRTPKNNVFKKPTIPEIVKYCRDERGNKVDAVKFFNHYESNGWKVGKNPMKDWKAAIITWERNQ